MAAANTRFLPPSHGNLYHFLSSYNKVLLRKLKELASGHNNSKPLLLADAGCGTMPYKPYVESLGMKYTGGDIFFQEGSGFEIKEDGSFILPDNTADIILSSFVLEHAIDYKLHLEECNRVTVPGGLVVLATHGHWYYHPAPNDYWRFTSEGLKKVLTDAGWEVISFEGIMSLNALAVQILQDNSRRFWYFKILTAAYTWCMQKFIALIDSFTPQKNKDKDAVAYLLVARKKLQ